MATMNISLPDAMKEFVEGEVQEGGFQTASEYFRELVRARQKQKSQEKLETLIREGEASGPLVEANPAFWEELERRLFPENAS